ncbi:hypothetical protein ACIP9H_40420 [Streptomyces sp. NPDC088732]|uniref:hypothetical protein n=1 Tax=Streptomyces sp. NPDC088732 TaxID=3365879 RepID=UPI0037F6AB5A
MDPTIKGAYIGASATALGAIIGVAGARVQAKAALKAVIVQARGQRYEAAWQVRRDAYAAFLGAVEQARGAMAHFAAVTEVMLAHPTQPFETPSEAKAALTDSMKALWHQQSVLRLSVTATEAATADSFLSVLNGVRSDLDAWVAEVLSNGTEATRLRAVYVRRNADLVDTVEHFIENAKGYLDGMPDLDPPPPGLLHRFRTWRIDRRYRSLDM